MKEIAANEPVPRFTLAAYFSAPKPCEDALLDLGNAYNVLADQLEEVWADKQRLEEQFEAMRDALDLIRLGCELAREDLKPELTRIHEVASNALNGVARE